VRKRIISLCGAVLLLIAGVLLDKLHGKTATKSLLLVVLVVGGVMVALSIPDIWRALKGLPHLRLALVSREPEPWVRVEIRRGVGFVRSFAVEEWAVVIQHAQITNPRPDTLSINLDLVIVVDGKERIWRADEDAASIQEIKANLPGKVWLWSPLHIEPRRSVQGAIGFGMIFYPSEDDAPKQPEVWYLRVTSNFTGETRRFDFPGQVPTVTNEPPPQAARARSKDLLKSRGDLSAQIRNYRVPDPPGSPTARERFLGKLMQQRDEELMNGLVGLYDEGSGILKRAKRGQPVNHQQWQDKVIEALISGGHQSQAERFRTAMLPQSPFPGPTQEQFEHHLGLKLNTLFDIMAIIKQASTDAKQTSGHETDAVWREWSAQADEEKRQAARFKRERAAKAIEELTQKYQEGVTLHETARNGSPVRVSAWERAVQISLTNHGYESEAGFFRSAKPTVVDPPVDVRISSKLEALYTITNQIQAEKNG
jgi:hypothetical protein